MSAARRSAVSKLAAKWIREAKRDLKTYGVVTHLGPFQAARELREAIKEDMNRGDTAG